MLPALHTGSHTQSTLHPTIHLKAGVLLSSVLLTLMTLFLLLHAGRKLSSTSSLAVFSNNPFTVNKAIVPQSNKINSGQIAVVGECC